MSHIQTKLSSPEIVGFRGDILDDEVSLGMYSTDASVYQIKPRRVVLPRDEADVLLALAYAEQHHMNVLPRGGGTSLAGQTVGESLIIDFSKYMNQLLELNVEEGWAIVQPGLVRDELNEMLKPYGLHFAPDPATSSRANIGGMIGNNSSGTKSILYGKTVDHVLELKVALADGTILHVKEQTPESYAEIAAEETREGIIYREFQKLVQTHQAEIIRKFPKVMRRVGGYNLDEFVNTDQWNLSKLLTGSEGTLCVTLEAKINLVPLPRYKSVCVVHYHEVMEAICSVNEMLPFHPAAIEILDHPVVNLSRKNLTTQPHSRFIEGDPAAILIVEFYGDTEEEVMERPQHMIRHLQDTGMGYAYPLFPEGASYEDVWTIRKKGLGLMLGIKGNKKPLAFIEDAGIPTEVLPEYIEKALEVCKKHETEVAMYAHASVGVIHLRPILDLRQEEDIQRFRAIAEEVFELVKHYGGSWSGEHGDGMVRSYFNEAFFGPEVYGALKAVKELFDPQYRMNPGKIVDAPPIDQHLRYGAAYKDRALKTVYQYREDNSFADAVHMCTGVGECRKMLGGTMCPSFKVTRDEEHSTRGRANALRLAMSGQLGDEGMASERLKEVLELCISCKACKSECPSNVDMAKLKSEVQQMYYDRKGITLRDRMIKDAPKAAARFAGRLAKTMNRIQSSAWFRNALEKRAGFDKRRVLPEYASETFMSWYKKRPGKNGKTVHTPDVVLFVDTYLNYYEPQVGKAALNLLEDCGYQVSVAAVGCCQRPAISHGFIREAQKAGALVAEKLDAYMKQGIPVVVCEPSCASALNDDLPDLLVDEALASRLKQQVMMIDVFLAKEKRAGKLDRIEFGVKHDKIAIHGHCHQKALYGTASMKVLLEGKVEIDDWDTACCGMAGSFGYEKEHYHLSEKMGERALFPAVKNLEKDAGLVACGFSCRHQIAHFTEGKPKHWVELVEVRRLK